ncbi:MAG: pirin family protein [bacterium]
MKAAVHRADSRGGADHGWLKTRHSFSFANWHDPERDGFGALRVLNDDVIAPHQGFGAHPHRDFEIVTIVTRGAVTHEDGLGTRAKVAAGEVQVMSAGTGVVHSEKNEEDEPLELFQLWIVPKERGVAPRYDRKRFDEASRKNALQLLVSDTGEDGSLMIRQDARIYLADLAAGAEIPYQLPPGRGAYVFVVEGEVKIGEVLLKRRDALAVSDSSSFSITPVTAANILVIDVPV